MRRTRRGRLLNWGLMFLIYSAIQVYSATIREAFSESSQSTADDAPLTEESPSNTSPNPNIELFYTTDRYAATTELDEIVQTTKASDRPHSHPTYRPKRENCTPPAIEQFPKPLMSPNVRKHGGLVIHVLVAIFTFLGLAIVCDDYFVASLDRICEGVS